MFQLVLKPLWLLWAQSRRSLRDGTDPNDRYGLKAAVRREAHERRLWAVFVGVLTQDCAIFCNAKFGG